jgi:hypothetical protein
LLKIIGIGASELENRVERNPEEGDMLCNLVYLSFTVLEIVLVSKEYYMDKGTMCSLEHSLLNGRVRSGEALILVIASYINLANSAVAKVATSVLSLLCRMKVGGDYPLLVGYLAPQKYALRKAFLSNLSDQRNSDDLRIAILDLISNAIETQPGLAGVFLLKVVTDKDEKWQMATLTDTKANLFSEPDDSVIISLLNDCSDLYSKRPSLLASTLDLLASLWNNASAQHAFIAELRRQKNFWPHLAQLFQKDPYASHDPKDTPASEVAENRAYRILIRARALQVAYSDIVSNSTLDSALVEELKDFFSEKLTNPESVAQWVSSETQCSYDAKLRQDTAQAAESLGINLESFATLPHHQAYGNNYYFNVKILAKKLGYERYSAHFLN